MLNLGLLEKSLFKVPSFAFDQEKKEITEKINPFSTALFSEKNGPLTLKTNKRKFESKKPKNPTDVKRFKPNFENFKDLIQATYGEVPFEIGRRLQSPPCLDKVILPALAKNIFLRAPLPSEETEIFENHTYDLFFVTEQQEVAFSSVIHDYGTLKSAEKNKIKKLVLATDLSDGKIKGSIYYSQNGKKGNILFINVNENSQNAGYGSLLYCYALFDCLENNCTLIKVAFDDDGLNFYTSFNLIPSSHLSSEWEALSFEEKKEFYEREFATQYYDLTRKKNLAQLNLRLNKVISKTFEIQRASS
jgi:hypothetical protein